MNYSYYIESHLVENISLKSKKDNLSKNKKNKINFKIESKLQLNTKDSTFVKLSNDIDLKSEIYSLKITHSFLIKFAQEISQDDMEISSDKIRDELLSITFPYSRAVIMNIMVNCGYGDLSIPLINLTKE